MSAEKVTVGQIVISAAGRDKGHIYVVIEKLSPFVLVANGRDRKVKCPKKKNVRHIKSLGVIEKTMTDLLKNEVKITDEVIRQALKQVIPD